MIQFNNFQLNSKHIAINNITVKSIFIALVELLLSAVQFQLITKLNSRAKKNIEINSINHTRINKSREKIIENILFELIYAHYTFFIWKMKMMCVIASTLT